MAFNVQSFLDKFQFGGAVSSLFTASVHGIGDSDFADFEFFCNQASLPASSLSHTPVNYFGRTVNVAGERTYGDSGGGLSLQVINDEDFKFRAIFEQWINSINESVLNVRNNGVTSAPSTYKGMVTVRQFSKMGPIGTNEDSSSDTGSGTKLGAVSDKDKDSGAIKAYIFYGVFPTSVGAIQLNWAKGGIEEYPVSFAYDYWQPDPNFAGAGSAGSADLGVQALASVDIEEKI